MFQDIGLTVLTSLVLIMISVPPILFFIWYVHDRRQSQHSVLRNFPLLGRVRYFLEMMGPELRQYMFDADDEGRPFSRVDFSNIVIQGKYLKTVIGFGSKRDFEKPGFYIRNSMFPKQKEEMRVIISPKIRTKRYVGTEGLFSRKEYLEEVEVSPWTVPDKDAIIIGPDCKEPWKVRGPVGMSAMSYGALGENAISYISYGLGMATGSWVHTGEGGLAPYHTVGGGDVIMQIGSGIFGVRNEDGSLSWEKFKEKAANPHLRCFEIKLA